MKKSTGIVFLVVLALAAFAYFHEWRGHPSSTPSSLSDNPNPNTVNLAFPKLQEADIAQIQLTRGGMTMVFVHDGDNWSITEPFMTGADTSLVNGIAHGLAALPEDRVLQANAQELNTYGLADPAVTIQFKMQNGATHTIALGGKDFSGLEVYTRIDGSKDVALVTNTIAEAADKPLESFRDHTVLVFPSQYDVTAFDLKNSAEDVTGKRDGSGWDVLKPIPTPGDPAAIATMIDGVGSAKVDRFISDDAKTVPPAKLAQYGLANPALRLNFTITGGKSAELLLGKKDGANDYYGEDVSRAMIFDVPADVFTKLNQLNLGALRSKSLYGGDGTDVTALEVQNAKGVTTKCVRSGGGLFVQQAPGQTGQALDCPDFLTPLETVKAKKVEDQPSAEERARLAKPAIVISMTEVPATISLRPSDAQASQQPPKNLEIQISAAQGNSVYARTSAGPTIYEFDKTAFDSLNDTQAAPRPPEPDEKDDE